MANAYRFVVPVTLSAALLAFTACSGGNMGSSAPGNAMQPLTTSHQAVVAGANADRDLFTNDNVSVLKQLNDKATIGSTVDPINGDQNPYGLDVAKVNNGIFDPGDLVVCNFNDRANIQGNGTTIIALHPRPGSKPIHVAQNHSLKGCDWIALAPDDTIWAASFVANENPIFDTNGNLLTEISNGPWHRPFGQTFSPTAGPFGAGAFYVTNAGDGSLVRINLTSGPFTFDIIATGFAVNHGAPGGILGPTGMQYDAEHDRLYIVDGADNTLVAFRGVSSIPASGIVVHGKTFSGPFANRARLIYAGPPLNGPISSALLAGGHLVLGNTLDPAGQNLMVEITPSGHVLAVKNVDTGAGGAIFGMVATGTGPNDTNLYFNDDNDNTVKVLSR
jgi:hypothetical protein